MKIFKRIFKPENAFDKLSKEIEQRGDERSLLIAGELDLIADRQKENTAKSFKAAAAFLAPIAQSETIQAAKPIIDVAQPVIQAAKPIIDVAQPVTQVARPIIKEAKPVIQAARPIIEEAKPVIKEPKKTVKILDNKKVKTTKSNSGKLVSKAKTQTKKLVSTAKSNVKTAAQTKTQSIKQATQTAGGNITFGKAATSQFLIPFAVIGMVTLIAIVAFKSIFSNRKKRR